MVIAPSLTEIFSASIRAGVVGSRQYTKVCKVVLSQTTIVPRRLSQSLQRSLKKLSLINYMSTFIPANMSVLVSVITYSTLTALLEATSDCSVNIDNGHFNGVVFIDLKRHSI